MADAKAASDSAASIEATIPVTYEDQPETVVVTFRNREDAEEAIRVINKALRKRPGTIHQGALVTREADESEPRVHDLQDAGLFDIAGGGARLLLDTGRDGARLIWSTIGAGLFFLGGSWRLVRSVSRRSLALAGSTLTIPRRRRLDAFGARGQVEPSSLQIEPGGSAVVLVADHETAVDLANELLRSGGELV
jgi:hypothetical protein